ncbi:transposase [Nostoc sp. MG11]|uniref:transposase n=1 Tax=Nostoc sp. MG11 TaxID=2721166 RepID=UPI0018672CD1|nr:transposase [Nostoc sp. MG11]
MNKEYRRGKHSVTSLKSHLVFVTKYRKKIFDVERLEVLILAFHEIARKMDFSIIRDRRSILGWISAFSRERDCV